MADIKTKRLHIEFEVPEDVTAATFHEWLCTAIHEGDEESYDELAKNTSNIIDMDNRIE